MKTIAAFVGSLLLTLGLLATSACAAPAEHKGQSDKRVIYAVGDSITWGGSPWNRQRVPYPTALDKMCGDECKVRNVGKPGACLLLEDCYYPQRMRELLREKVWPKRPDVVIVSIGANDLGARLSTSDMKDEYRAIRADGASHGVEVLLATISPGRKFWPADCEAQRLKLNDWIRTLPHVDFDAALANEDEQLRIRYDSGDGLHPSTRGYGSMAREAWRVLN